MVRLQPILWNIIDFEPKDRETLTLFKLVVYYF